MAQAQAVKAPRLQCHLCALEKNLSSGVAHVSPLWSPHPPLTTHTSSSSLHDPHTQRVHHAHLQALLVDQQRHQEPLWHEDLQSGGNLRTTTPTLCFIDGHMSPKNSEWEPKLQKNKGRVVLQENIVKEDLWSLRSIHLTRLLCAPNDCCNNHGRYCKITRF